MTLMEKLLSGICGLLTALVLILGIALYLQHQNFVAFLENMQRHGVKIASSEDAYRSIPGFEKTESQPAPASSPRSEVADERMSDLSCECDGRRYGVQYGDTLSEIALRFTRSSEYQFIVEANNDKITDPDLIYAGDCLCIPGIDPFVPPKLDVPVAAQSELELQGISRVEAKSSAQYATDAFLSLPLNTYPLMEDQYLGCVAGDTLSKKPQYASEISLNVSRTCSVESRL